MHFKQVCVVDVGCLPLCLWVQKSSSTLQPTLHTVFRNVVWFNHDLFHGQVHRPDHIGKSYHCSLKWIECHVRTILSISCLMCQPEPWLAGPPKWNPEAKETKRRDSSPPNLHNIVNFFNSLTFFFAPSLLFEVLHQSPAHWKSFGMTGPLWFHKLFLFNFQHFFEVANNMGSTVTAQSPVAPSDHEWHWDPFWGAAVSPFFCCHKTGVVKRKLSGAELGQIGQKACFTTAERRAMPRWRVRKLEENRDKSGDNVMILLL